jgi:hypothetical protein
MTVDQARFDSKILGCRSDKARTCRPDFIDEGENFSRSRTKWDVRQVGRFACDFQSEERVLGDRAQRAPRPGGPPTIYAGI